MSMQVIATGRNPKSLAAVHALDKRRVIPVQVEGSEKECSTALQTALGGKAADAVVDCSGDAKSPDSLLACLGALRPRGILTIVGSLDVPLPLNTGAPTQPCAHCSGIFAAGLKHWYLLQSCTCIYLNFNFSMQEM